MFAANISKRIYIRIHFRILAYLEVNNFFFSIILDDLKFSVSPQRAKPNQTKNRV